MEWTRGPTIGRGASATVSLATTFSGELFAVKSSELNWSGFLQREYEVLSRLDSGRIIKCLGFDVTCEDNKKPPVYNLFMEYVPGGSLSDVIEKRGGSLEEPAIRLYTHQILQGLDYLHMNGLAHCDIKGRNVLIGKDGAKIADLGCARIPEKSDFYGGTPVFMAPEVARGEEQGFPADVWALGCTVIEMATGNIPWPEVNDPISALYRIGYSENVPKFPGWLSKDGKDFLSKCLDREAKNRWTVKQLLQHPFFYELKIDSEEEEEEEAGLRNSPTGVLDQDFWDSLETTKSSRNPTDFSLCSNSPAERIRNLTGGASASSSNLPNWLSEEEDWITVRSHQFETNCKSSQKNQDLGPDEGPIIDMDHPTTSFTNLSEELNFGSSIEYEHFSLHYLDGETIRIDCPSFSTDFSSVQDVSVSRFLMFETKVNENFSCSVQFFFSAFSSSHNEFLTLCVYASNCYLHSKSASTGNSSD